MYKKFKINKLNSKLKISRQEKSASEIDLISTEGFSHD